MSRILLRVLKRLTAVEEGPAEFAELAFNDTEMSVYLLEDGPPEVTRGHAEHAAGLLKSPGNRFGLALSTTPPAAATLAECPGETGFAFTVERHREIRFLDMEEAHAAGRAVFESREEIARNLGVAELKAYARARLLERDAEWHRVCSDPAKERWGKCMGSG